MGWDFSSGSAVDGIVRGTKLFGASRGIERSLARSCATDQPLSALLQQLCQAVGVGEQGFSELGAAFSTESTLDACDAQRPGGVTPFVNTCGASHPATRSRNEEASQRTASGTSPHPQQERMVARRD